MSFQVTLLTAITLASTICYVGLFVLVLLGSPRRGANRIFAFYLGVSIVWNLGGFMMFVDDQRALLWNKVLVLGSLGVFFTFFHFVLVFLNVKGKRLLVYLGYGLFVVLGGLNLGGLVIRDVTITQGTFRYEMGPAIIPMFFAGYTYLGLSMFYLLQRYRSSQDEFYRNKIRYPLVGLSFMLAGGATNAAPILGSYGLDHLGNLFMALIVGYAILRHRLLDLRFVIRRGLVYSSLMVVITATYLVAVFSLQRLLHAIAGYSGIITAVVVAIFVAAVFLPFRDLMQRLVDGLFFRERHDYQKMLRAAGKAATEMLDLGELAGATMQLVDKVMHVTRFSMFVLEDDAYVCHPGLRNGHVESNDGNFTLRKDSPIITYLASHDVPLGVEDIGTLPQFRGLWKDERELVDTLELAMLLPLKARGQLVGVLAFGPKLSGEAYSVDELELLSTLANQMSIAVDNARLLDEAKRSYQQLKSAQDYMVQSERLRALGQMASGVAHDFNNLLAAILGRAQLALGLTSDEKVVKNLKIIEEAALGGAATVQRLQTFTRVRTDQNFSPVDLNEVVESTLRMVEAQRTERQEVAGIKIEVITQLDKAVTALGNAGDLRDALTNIVLNAIDAMPRGGKLTVKTKQENGLAVVVVTDTGVGIPDDVKHRIFDPFYTTKGARGTGLGLSVAYGVVTRHGGKIEVESQVNKGSTFYIKLPVSTKPAQGKYHATAPARSSEAALLIVDDDKEVAEVLKLMLVEAGYKVALAASGTEAVDSFRQDRYDLVITDLGMPDISGRDIARQVCSIRPGTPVILITGWGVQLKPLDMLGTGIVQVINKPFSLEELLSKVAQALNTASQPRSENVQAEA